MTLLIQGLYSSFLRFSFSTFRASPKLRSSICFSVLLRFIAIAFDMSFSFLSIQVVNSCSSSLIVLSACRINASVSFISSSITSICLLFLSCSFSDLLVSKSTSYFCRADWVYCSNVGGTLNS